MRDIEINTTHKNVALISNATTHHSYSTENTKVRQNKASIFYYAHFSIL